MDNPVVYKVVRETGYYWSSLYTLQSPTLTLHYALGQSVQAHIGKVYCFNTLENAIQYALHVRPKREHKWVLACEAINSTAWTTGLRHHNSINISRLKDYWDSYQNYDPSKSGWGLILLPHGTILCDQITPKSVEAVISRGEYRSVYRQLNRWNRIQERINATKTV